MLFLFFVSEASRRGLLEKALQSLSNPTISEVPRVKTAAPLKASIQNNMNLFLLEASGVLLCLTCSDSQMHWN